MAAPYDQMRLHAILQQEQHAMQPQDAYYQGAPSRHQTAGDPQRGAKSRKSAGGSAGKGARHAQGMADMKSGYSPMSAHLPNLHQATVPGHPQHQMQHQERNLQQEQQMIQQQLLQQHWIQIAAQQSPQMHLLGGLPQAAMHQKVQPAKTKQLTGVQVFLGTEPKTDKSVPHMVDKLVPEAELYQRLLKVEELLDQESAKQAWEIEDALRERPSLLRTLRITVCNTHKNQPAAMRSCGTDSQEIAHNNAALNMGTGPPEWTLHILGEALGVEQGSQKLSDFIDKVLAQDTRTLVVYLHVCACLQG
jgi:hypothetical protein